jgi:hypothetical protein
MMDQVILDRIGGVLCGLTALGFFTGHVVSSKRCKAWIALPEWLRGTYFVAGALTMIRSVGLLSTVTPVSHQPIPPLAVLVSGSFTVAICGTAAWAVAHYFPDNVWDRLAYAVRRERENPNLIPVAIERAQVIDLAEQSGIVVMNPAEPEETDR